MVKRLQAEPAQPVGNQPAQAERHNRRQQAEGDRPAGDIRDGSDNKAFYLLLLCAYSGADGQYRIRTGNIPNKPSAFLSFFYKIKCLVDRKTAAE